MEPAPPPLPAFLRCLDDLQEILHTHLQQLIGRFTGGKHSQCRKRVLHLGTEQETGGDQRVEDVCTCDVSLQAESSKQCKIPPEPKIQCTAFHDCSSSVPCSIDLWLASARGGTEGQLHLHLRPKVVVNEVVVVRSSAIRYCHSSASSRTAAATNPGPQGRDTVLPSIQKLLHSEPTSQIVAWPVSLTDLRASAQAEHGFLA